MSEYRWNPKNPDGLCGLWLRTKKQCECGSNDGIPCGIRANTVGYEDWSKRKEF